jgi:hypothetical protein
VADHVCRILQLVQVEPALAPLRTEGWSTRKRSLT